MKTIGLLGGMSWESTVSYYQIINEEIKKQLGGLHSAKIVMYSVDFSEIEECQMKGEWDKSANILSHACQSLEKAGADFILICTNTMHKVAPQIQSSISIPLIHIAEATAQSILDHKISKVVLLGTKYTMTEMFYKEKLIDAGIDVIVPNDVDIEIINDIIFKELCLGIISETSKQAYLKVIGKLIEEGAQGVILGCTEIGLLIHESDLDLPVFDTTLIHAKKAALLAVE